MSNLITTAPPEGQFVYVTDNGVETQAAWWDGKWRDVLADGGHLVFSDTATWDIVGQQAAPKKVKKAAAEDAQ